MHRARRRWLVIFSTLMLTWLAPSHCIGQDAAAANEAMEYRQKLATAVRTAAERVLPSIVSIEVIGVAETVGGSAEQSEVAMDAPSCGVVVDAKGFIVASDLIVRRASASLLVVLPDATRLAAKVVARDHHRGLVMLRVQPSSTLVAVDLPAAVDVPIGSTVVAVGRYGADQSPMVSSGILSATGRLEGTMLQSDARVSPSFYGGLLIDLYGRAIGVVVPAIADGGAPDDTSWYDSGIAFAVPSFVLKNKLPRLLDGQDIRKGLIGIVPKSNDPYAEGTELAAVRSRSPAEKAGILAGDRIESIAGKPVKMFQEIKEALGPYDAGDSIQISLQRDDQVRETTVTLTDSIPPLNPQRLGIWVQESVSDTRSIVTIRAVIAGTTADGKLKPGDVIDQVDQTEISDVATISRLLIAAVPEQPLQLSITRDGQPVDVDLTPAPVAGAKLKQTVTEWTTDRPENPWDTAELRLPDVANLAAYVAPKTNEATAADGIAMLVLLLPPEQRDPEKALLGWRETATQHGVVVCAICSEDEKRWQPKEIDVVSRMATMMSQRIPITVSAVASAGVVKGASASAADAMVIAIAFSDRKNFSGIAVSAQTRPPAVRLRENEPDRALQVLVPIDSIEDGPTWLAPLSTAGYPIVLAGESDQGDLLQWVRLLQTI